MPGSGSGWSWSSAQSLSWCGPGPTAGSAGVRTLLADIQLLADLAQEADADGTSLWGALAVTASNRPG